MGSKVRNKQETHQELTGCHERMLELGGALPQIRMWPSGPKIVNALMLKAGWHLVCAPLDRDTFQIYCC